MIGNVCWLAVRISFHLKVISTDCLMDLTLNQSRIGQLLRMPRCLATNCLKLLKPVMSWTTQTLNLWKVVSTSTDRVPWLPKAASKPTNQLELAVSRKLPSLQHVSYGSWTVRGCAAWSRDINTVPYLRFSFVCGGIIHWLFWLISDRSKADFPLN